MSEPFILQAGGQHPSAPSPESRGQFIRIPSSATDGLLAMSEVKLPPLTTGPNLHTHTREDEPFYVLDRVLTVQIGDQLHEIEQGGVAWGARGSMSGVPDPEAIMALHARYGATGFGDKIPSTHRLTPGHGAPGALPTLAGVVDLKHNRLPSHGFS